MTPRKRKPDTRKGRSGTKWTEADYAAGGWTRLTLRLPPEESKQLARLQRDGETAGVTIRRLIREASK